MAPVRFLFDYLSPYAYLAWTQIHGVAQRTSREVEPVPVLFAALLNARGTKGPAEIAGKREYVFKDAFRNAHRAGVPIDAPATHPFNPLLALRVSALPMPSDARKKLVDALFAATWAQRRRVDLPDVVATIASSVGLEGEAMVKAANEDEAKARIRKNSDEAIARGAWGVPTMLAVAPDGTEDLFWGFDALPHLEAFLRGEDPVPKNAFERWGDLKASASRT